MRPLYGIYSVTGVSTLAMANDVRECLTKSNSVYIVSLWLLYTDDVLGMLLNIEEDKVVFYLNGEAIERYFPAKDRWVYMNWASLGVQWKISIRTC